MDDSEFKPAYLELGVKSVRQRALMARELMSPCRLCPRECSVDRLGGEKGFCKTGVDPIVSSRGLHPGEEPPISGYNGSGTIFFSNCNLSCIFCQNYPISQLGVGSEIKSRQLASSMITLQERGAHNINFVTPSHVVGSILEALAIAMEEGLALPLLYNSSGYDSMDELKLLDGVVDIYLPDMKYSSDEYAAKYSSAINYVEVNRAAIKEMHRQVGVLQMDDRGIAGRGLLIRHLMLPDGKSGTEDVLKFIAEEISTDTYVSLMSQFFPANRAGDSPEMGRYVSKAEYEEATEILHKYGLESGYVQGCY